jgi:hypothetical protein
MRLCKIYQSALLETGKIRKIIVAETHGLEPITLKVIFFSAVTQHMTERRYLEVFLLYAGFENGIPLYFILILSVPQKRLMRITLVFHGFVLPMFCMLQNGEIKL